MTILTIVGTGLALIYGIVKIILVLAEKSRSASETRKDGTVDEIRAERNNVDGAINTWVDSHDSPDSLRGK